MCQEVGLDRQPGAFSLPDGLAQAHEGIVKLRRIYPFCSRHPPAPKLRASPPEKQLRVNDRAITVSPPPTNQIVARRLCPAWRNIAARTPRPSGAGCAGISDSALGTTNLSILIEDQPLPHPP